MISPPFLDFAWSLFLCPPCSPSIAFTDNSRRRWMPFAWVRHLRSHWVRILRLMTLPWKVAKTSLDRVRNVNMKNIPKLLIITSRKDLPGTDAKYNGSKEEKDWLLAQANTSKISRKRSDVWICSMNGVNRNRNDALRLAKPEWAWTLSRHEAWSYCTLSRLRLHRLQSELTKQSFDLKRQGSLGLAWDVLSSEVLLRWIEVIFCLWLPFAWASSSENSSILNFDSWTSQATWYLQYLWRPCAWKVSSLQRCHESK